MRKDCLLACALLLPLAAAAQLWNGTDTLYGNEWIDHTKTYYKIRVADDGIYRVPYPALVAAGFPVADAPGAGLRLYRYGQQEPLYATTDGPLGPQDFLEFFGEKNRDALDRHLFDNPDADNLNPWYSLFNDTAAYYLVWEPATPPLRYTPVPNDLSSPPPPRNPSAGRWRASPTAMPCSSAKSATRSCTLGSTGRDSAPSR